MTARATMANLRGSLRPLPPEYARRHTGRVPLLDLADAVDRSAAPAAVRLSVERLLAPQPPAAARLHEPHLVAAVVAVIAASRELARRVEVDPAALAVLA